MKKSEHLLRRIYDRTSGYCHLCGKKLSLINYNCSRKRGAWHIDHSKPRSTGGGDNIQNLYVACIGCNSDKSNFSTKTARAWNGRARAPMSKRKRKSAKLENALLGAGVGMFVGSLFGPLGRLIGIIAGAHIGNKANPD